MMLDPWSCPNCRTAMVRGTFPLLVHWHCPACQFDWVHGDVLAAFLPSTSAFAKLRESAVAGRPPTRALECPSCRAQTLRVVQVGKAEIDVCHQCVSVALDPGEMADLKSMRHSKARSIASSLDAPDVIEAIDGVDLIELLLSLLN